MALGSFGLSRPRQARSEGVLPSCRHPAAPELQQRDEKGKAQESVGSWAFPAFISSILSVMPGSDRASSPKSQKQDVRSSDNVLRNRQFSSSELGENRVTSDILRAHIHIYVFLRFCVYILMCLHTNTSTHSHIHMQICFYVLIQVCSYAFITV